MYALKIIVLSVYAATFGASEPYLPCCVVCNAPKEKYYSIVDNLCGETCIVPATYPLWKFFEPNLKPSSVLRGPCNSSGYKYYVKTKVDSFGPITYTVDYYT